MRDGLKVPVAERWHGTYGGYTNHDCRCEACRRAATVRHLRYMNAHPEQREKQRAYMRRYNKKKRSSEPSAQTKPDSSALAEAGR
jgi:hypothetical protein